MSAHPNTLRAPRKPFWRRQRFWRFTLPVVAVVVAAASGLFVFNALVGSNGDNPKSWGVTYPEPTTPKTVALDQSVRGVVHRFIWTAVARKNLRAAYWLAGPQVRQGMSLQQWLKGEIAVVPFPVNDKTKENVTVKFSYPNRARLQIFLGTPDRKITNSPHTFFVDLIKQHGKWLVNGWVPRWTPPIPTVPGR